MRHVPAAAGGWSLIIDRFYALWGSTKWTFMLSPSIEYRVSLVQVFFFMNMFIMLLCE